MWLEIWPGTTDASCDEKSGHLEKSFFSDGIYNFKKSFLFETAIFKKLILLMI